MIILPTRGRPGNLKRFFECYEDTDAVAPGIVCVDDDDPRLVDYFPVRLPDNWRMSINSRIGLGPMINRAFQEHPSEAWYGAFSDDAVPVTKGWDAALIEAAGADGMSYCADGINDEKQAGNCVLGGDFVRSLGWIILPGLTRIYGDNVLTEIAQKRGVLHYLSDVRIEHWHFSNGRAPMDETYRKPEAGNDRRIYEQWKTSQSAA